VIYHVPENKLPHTNFSSYNSFIVPYKSDYGSQCKKALDNAGVMSQGPWGTMQVDVVVHLPACSPFRANNSSHQCNMAAPSKKCICSVRKFLAGGNSDIFAVANWLGGKRFSAKRGHTKCLGQHMILSTGKTIETEPGRYPILSLLQCYRYLRVGSTG
jgi:hypothetical protein